MTASPTTPPLTATVNGLKAVDRWLETQGKTASKALNTALRVEAFRLRSRLKADIRQGAPGGRPLAPLSYIARRMQRSVRGEGGTSVRQNPNRKPLARLALAVRYKIDPSTRDVRVGFVDHGAGHGRLSNTWRRIAKAHQEGFTRPVTDKLRSAIIRRGGELGKSQDGRNPFFLSPKTREFKTPARPIIQPFWQANQSEAVRNIRRNFNLKMAGGRI